MAWFVDALDRHGARPGGGAGPEWFAEPAFRGCAFINAVAEVCGSVAGAADIASRHKAEMVEVIAALLPDGTDRAAIADAAALAVDGAIVRAQVDGGARRWVRRGGC